MKMDSIDLLMVGKTGSGKSSTGNSILWQNVFRTTLSTDSETSEICCQKAEYNGATIKVVDSPGLGDTRYDDEEALLLVVEEMEKAFSLNPEGFHAFILCIPFGRFNEKDMIRIIKSIFGRGAVKKYFIICMTMGDLFQRERLSFPQWYQNQGGVYKELCRECGDRVVVFDNVTKDEKTKLAQIDELIQWVCRLPVKGGRYSKSDFLRANAERMREIVESRKARIHAMTMQKCDHIQIDLTKIGEGEDTQQQISKLEKLQERAYEIKQYVQEEDKETNVLRETLSNVEIIMTSITDTIKNKKMVKKMSENQENFRREMREEAERKEKEMLRQRKESEEKMRQENREREEKQRQEMRAEMERKEKEMLRQRKESEEKMRQENREREEKQRQESDRERARMERLLEQFQNQRISEPASPMMMPMSSMMMPSMMMPSMGGMSYDNLISSIQTSYDNPFSSSRSSRSSRSSQASRPAQQPSQWICGNCGRDCHARIGLWSHSRACNKK